MDLVYKELERLFGEAEQARLNDYMYAGGPPKRDRLGRPIIKANKKAAEAERQHARLLRTQSLPEPGDTLKARLEGSPVLRLSRQVELVEPDAYGVSPAHSYAREGDMLGTEPWRMVLEDARDMQAGWRYGTGTYKAAVVPFPEGARLSEVAHEPVFAFPLLAQLNVIDQTEYEIHRGDVSGTVPVGGGLIELAPSIDATGGTGVAEADVFHMHRRAEHVRYARRWNVPYVVERIKNLLRYHDRNLQYELIVGDGSTVGDRIQELGILSTTGIGSVAKTTTGTAALRSAIALVQAQGFGGSTGSLTVVGNPTDLSELLGETDYDAGRFPSVGAIVPLPPLTAGTLVVGDFSTVDLYVQKPGRVLSSTLEHVDDFLRGLAVMQVDQHVYLDVKDPGAFAKITGG
jgi:hypothetical protein